MASKEYWALFVSIFLLGMVAAVAVQLHVGSVSVGYGFSLAEITSLLFMMVGWPLLWYYEFRHTTDSVKRALGEDDAT